MGAYGAFPPYYATQTGMYAPMSLQGMDPNQMHSQQRAMMHSLPPQGQSPSLHGALSDKPSGVSSTKKKTSGKKSTKKTSAKKKTAKKKKPKKKIVKKKKPKKLKPKKKPKKKKPKPKKKPKKKKPKKKVPPKKPKISKKMLTKSGRKRKEKDPDAPKRARTAFNFFLDSFREQYKKDFPEAKGVVGVTKAGSEKWRAMTDADKKEFEALANVAREAYQKQKEEYEAAGGNQKFKMLKAPPRPPTAYFMFLSEFREEYKKLHPDVKGIKEMSKEAGEKWRSMDAITKEPYDKKAALAKEEYKKLKAMSPEERVAATKDCKGKNVYAKFM